MIDVVAREDDPAGWEALVRSGLGGWWYQRAPWIDYLAARRPDRDDRPMSFLVREGGQFVAAVVLDEDRTTRAPGVGVGREGEACWSPVLAPSLSRADRLRVLRFVWEHVDQLARDRGWESGAWQASPLGRGFDHYLPDFLASTTRAGFRDTSLCTQILDLRLGESSIRRAMSKGHRAAITTGRRQITPVASSDPSSAYFDAYVELHDALAGAQGRPRTTYEMMRAWMDTDHGVLVTALLQGAPVGFVYVIVDDAKALYMSTAVEESHERLPVGHVLQDEAIRWLGAHGVEEYELGIQPFGGLPYDDPTPKERNIGLYKRGFGGYLAPLARRDAPWSRPISTG